MKMWVIQYPEGAIASIRVAAPDRVGACLLATAHTGQQINPSRDIPADRAGGIVQYCGETKEEIGILNMVKRP